MTEPSYTVAMTDDDVAAARAYLAERADAIDIAGENLKRGPVLVLVPMTAVMAQAAKVLIDTGSELEARALLMQSVEHAFKVAAIMQAEEDRPTRN